MKKNTVKKIFIFFMFFLPLQYAAVGIVGVLASEPWPAFVFPGFKSVMANSEVITVEKPVFTVETEKGEQTIDSQILFEGMKESQRLGFIKTNFSDSLKASRLTANARTWLKERIKNQHSNAEEPQALTISWLKKNYVNNDGNAVLESEFVQKKIRIKL